VKIITLTTDFGTKDWFVGAVKGVILGIEPQVTVVDISHEIGDGNIQAGAFALAASCRFFPRHSIHMAVVDPGVGSARAGLAVQTEDYVFVGPDNGVLSLALTREKIKVIRRLENERYFLKSVSRTFHGRDIFAPVAAHLCQGVSPLELGSAQEDYVKLDWPQTRQEGDYIAGGIVYVDRFGNALTNIDGVLLSGCLKLESAILVNGKPLCSLKSHYQAVPLGQPVGVIGSTGFLEIAVNGGSAAEALGLKINDPVAVRAGSKTC